VEFQPAAGTFTLTPYVDAAGKSSQAIDIGASVATYGSGVYGTSTYGSAARQQAAFTLPLNAEGRSFAYRARYAGQREFKWFSYATVLVPESALRGR
jgi:hypothetical protein